MPTRPLSATSAALAASSTLRGGRANLRNASAASAASSTLRGEGPISETPQ